MYSSLFDKSQGVLVSQFLLCIGVALVMGILIAATYMIKAKYTASFVVTLAMLPAIVCVVIMMVNGNVGAGVAVAGAFSLVRFRSVPGSAKDIGTIFMAMGTGLILGMGYIGFGILFTVILCVAMFILSVLASVVKPAAVKEKTLRITIPESLNYDTAFNDLFDEYAAKCEIQNVKTTNMGSMYKLTYNLELKDLGKEKEFIDALRTRNGNLEISISKAESNLMEL